MELGFPFPIAGSEGSRGILPILVPMDARGRWLGLRAAPVPTAGEAAGTGL